MSTPLNQLMRQLLTVLQNRDGLLYAHDWPALAALLHKLPPQLRAAAQRLSLMRPEHVGPGKITAVGRLEPDVVAALVAALPGCRMLELIGCSGHLAPLVEAIGTAPLHVLVVDNSPQIQLRKFAPSVRGLVLTNQGIDSWERLRFMSYHYVQHIDLSGNPLGGKMRDIVLRLCTTHLVLQNCGLTDDDAEHTAASSWEKHLLDVGHNAFGPRGLEALAALPCRVVT